MAKIDPADTNIRKIGLSCKDIGGTFQDGIQLQFPSHVLKLLLDLKRWRSMTIATDFSSQKELDILILLLHLSKVQSDLHSHVLSNFTPVVFLSWIMRTCITIFLNCSVSHNRFFQQEQVNFN